jgi:hypothetical protein
MQMNLKGKFLDYSINQATFLSGAVMLKALSPDSAWIQNSNLVLIKAGFVCCIMVKIGPWSSLVDGEELASLDRYRTGARGLIFSCVQPFYERAVSDLDRPMHRFLWVQVAHSMFIQGSHTTKNTASVL